MKRVCLTFLAAGLLLISCNSDEKKDEKTASSTSTDTSKMSDAMAEKKSDNTYTVPDSVTATKNWTTYATPGDVHKMLTKSNGTWTSEITMWDKADGPSMKATSTTNNKMIMGDRYQISEIKGNMMGMPFEGMSTLAYDNLKKVFISTWIDNMGTGLSTMEGTWDDANKSITFKGKMVEPTIQKELDMREVFKIVDDNTQTMEMYKPGPDGKEFKNMEIKYTRKK